MSFVYWYRVLIVLVLVALPFGLLFAQTEVEVPPGDDGPGEGPIDLPNPLTADTIAELLNKIIDFLLIIAVPVAIIMAIWAGYLFMTGGASEENIKAARKTLLYVIIGVAILILSKGLINLVISLLKT